MISFLGRRGQLAAVAGTGVALGSAAAAAIQRNWTMATVLLVLAAVWLALVSTWGVARAVHEQLRVLDRKVTRLTKAQARHFAAAGKRADGNLASKLQKVSRNVETIAIRLGSEESDGFGERSLERRYAEQLTQPASVPNSQLLAYLELLSKDATTRRAEAGQLAEVLAELRSLRSPEGSSVDAPA